VPVPSQDKWEGCGRKGIQCNMGDEGGGLLIRPHGVAASRMVSVSASDISPGTIKPRRRFSSGEDFLLAPPHPGSPGKGCKMVVACVHRKTCISRHSQLTTAGFYWNKVLLSACPC